MKETYETPEVEMVEANVEKGFANTNPLVGTEGSEDEPE
jgi:hypothetical protein